MTHERDSSLDKAPVQPKAVRVDDLIEWHMAESMRVALLRGELNRVLKEPGAETDPDVALLAGRVEGRTHVLTSFGEFLIAKTQQP